MIGKPSIILSRFHESNQHNLITKEIPSFRKRTNEDDFRKAKTISKSPIYLDQQPAEEKAPAQIRGAFIRKREPSVAGNFKKKLVVCDTRVLTKPTGSRGEGKTYVSAIPKLQPRLTQRITTIKNSSKAGLDKSVTETRIDSKDKLTSEKKSKQVYHCITGEKLMQRKHEFKNSGIKKDSKKITITSGPIEPMKSYFDDSFVILDSPPRSETSTVFEPLELCGTPLEDSPFTIITEFISSGPSVQRDLLSSINNALLFPSSPVLSPEVYFRVYEKLALLFKKDEKLGRSAPMNDLMQMYNELNLLEQDALQEYRYIDELIKNCLIAYLRKPARRYYRGMGYLAYVIAFWAFRTIGQIGQEMQASIDLVFSDVLDRCGFKLILESKESRINLIKQFEARLIAEDIELHQVLCKNGIHIESYSFEELLTSLLEKTPIELSYKILNAIEGLREQFFVELLLGITIANKYQLLLRGDTSDINEFIKEDMIKSLEIESIGAFLLPKENEDGNQLNSMKRAILLEDQVLVEDDF